MNILDHISDDAIKNISPVILIRHGEKVIPPADKKFRDVPLTRKGKETSLRFGRELKDAFKAELRSIHSSPMKRCIMTSETISAGYGYAGETNLSELLGDPGPYVYDEKVAGETYLDTIPDCIVQRHLKEKNIPGFRTPEEGTSLLMDYLLSNWSEGLDVMITHDVVIAVLFGSFLGYIPDVDEWIDYLGGLCFYRVDEAMFMDSPEGTFDITKETSEFLKIEDKVMV